jgi:GNAT superfamily N-acetyltransferase
MNITLADINHLEQIFQNLQSSNQKLLSQGIYQWDETYPGKALLEADIHSKAMFVGLEEARVIASVSADTKQPNVYADISWHPATLRPLLIHRLCITPEKQGQGMGQKMLDFVEVYARE